MPNVANQTELEKALATIAQLKAEATGKEAIIEANNRRIAELEAAKNSLDLSWGFGKVGAKGAVSLRGLGQWPISMYIPSWLAFLTSPKLTEFIKYLQLDSTVQESRARGFAAEAADMDFKETTKRDYVHDERGKSGVKRMDGDTDLYTKLYTARMTEAFADPTKMSKAQAKRSK